MKSMRHDVDLRIAPVHELTVMPDLFGLWNSHENSIRVVTGFRQQAKVARASCP